MKTYIRLNVALTAIFLGSVFGGSAVAHAESIKFPPPSPLVFCKDGHGGHVQHAPCPPLPFGRQAGSRHIWN